MKRAILSAALAAAACIAMTAEAIGQTAPAGPDPVKLEISRATLAKIAQGAMKLPYEDAAPILNELQRQLDAQTPKPTDKKPAK